MCVTRRDESFSVKLTEIKAPPYQEAYNSEKAGVSESVVVKSLNEGNLSK